MTSQQSLSKKVTTSSIIFIVLVACAATFSIINILSIQTMLEYMQKYTIEQVYWNGQYNMSIQHVILEETQNIPEVQQTDVDDMNEAIEQLKQAMESLQHIQTSPQHQSIVGTSDEHTALYAYREKLLDDLIGKMGNNNLQGSEKRAFLEEFEGIVDDLAFESQQLVRRDIATTRHLIQERLQWGIVGISVTFALVILLTLLAMSHVQHYIVQPVKNVSKAAVEVTQGDLQQSVAITNQDEIGALQGAFNTMVQKLRATQENLEQQVAQRTTELQTAMQELAKRSQQLEQAIVQAQEARVAAETASRSKSTFLANMSHELRTPLNAILGFSQIMARSKDLSSEHQSNLSIVRRSGEHLLTLINDILNMSKIEAGHITYNEENFDLYRLLDDLEDMLQLRAADKQLQLIFECAPGVPHYIRSDGVKLRQILINLVNNSIKFTDKGGVAVRVYAEAQQAPTKTDATASSLPKPDVQGNEAKGDDALEPWLQYRRVRKKKQPDPPKPTHYTIRFEVEDTGAGIAPEDIDKLFEAFVQTKTGQQAQEGTGLGLTISRKFVELMGGTMQVSSTEGHGSLFSFTIEATMVDAKDVQAQQATQDIIGLQPGQPLYRILVVDDKWSNRHLLVKILEPLGFDMREASNGQEAVDIALSWHPNIIWMDVRMPVMDGYEATKRIKATPEGKPICIVAITASAQEEDRAVAFASGCDDFIRKPFRDNDIFLTMQKHIGVQYVYETDQAEDAHQQASGKPFDEALTPAVLATMPAEWVKKLHQAAGIANMRQMGTLIEQIREQHSQLAEELSKLVDDFRFDKITAITGPVVSDK